MILRNLTVFSAAVALAYFIGFAANIFNGDWQFLMWAVSLFFGERVCIRISGFY